MLNHGAVVAPFGEARFTEYPLFLRPIEDSKVFAGTIMERDAFEDW